MIQPKALKITPRGDREMVMTREFAAPRRLVFDAWTQPELLTRWFGIDYNGWRFAACEVDLRIGGAYRFEWRKAPSGVMVIHGVYREVTAPERTVYTECVSWFPGEAVNTAEFVEREGLTRLTITTVFDSAAARDGALASGMEEGLSVQLATLDDVLATLGG
jgi:uncharacterized protein YndB with AHSA1/START domain